jgi:hypothetical protein
MGTGPLLTDEQLLARLHAPPDLSEGVQSLTYWRERRRRLPWYRIRARREAGRMIISWEQRVRGALFTQRHVSVDIRASAGVLLASSLLRRWGRRGAIAVTTLIAVTIMAAPLIAAIVVLSRFA